MSHITQRTRDEKKTKKLARMLSIAGDATRLSILCFLFQSDNEACVSEIANASEISIATASYHLNKMADNDLLNRNRHGNTICYTPKDSEFVSRLENIICWDYQ